MRMGIHFLWISPRNTKRVLAGTPGSLRGRGGARGRMGLRPTVQTAVGQCPLSLTRRMAHRLRAKVLIHGTDLGALCPLENRQPDLWIATRRIRTRGGSKGEGLIWLPRRFRNHPTSVFLNTIYRLAGTVRYCRCSLYLPRPRTAGRESKRFLKKHVFKKQQNNKTTLALKNNTCLTLGTNTQSSTLCNMLPWARGGCPASTLVCSSGAPLLHGWHCVCANT
jgi:hypothetical protein